MKYPYIKSYVKDDIDLAELAKAMSHPGRIAMVRLLQKRDKCSLKDFVKILPLAPTTVSQHIKKLRHAGVISGRSKGGLIFYILNYKVLKDFNQSLKNLCKK